MATWSVARIFTNQSIVLEIFGCTRQYFLRFSAALAIFVRLVRPTRSLFYPLKGISVNSWNSWAKKVHIMHLWLRLGIARSNKYVGLALALPNALQFYSFSTDVWRRLGIVQASLASALALHKRYYTLCESRHFLWNYAEIIAISDKTGRKRRAIEVECSRHYAIHPYCRAAFHTEYVVFHGFYQDIYILYNVCPAVFW